MRRGVHVAQSEKRKPASAGGKAEFVGMATGNIGERNVSEGCRDIGADEGAAGHASKLQEASGRDGHPAKVKTGCANIRITLDFRQSFGEGIADRGLWGKADTDWVGIWGGSWRWSRLRRRVPDLGLGLLFLAALLGDALLEVLQPRLEQANLGGRVVGLCRAGLEAHKRAQCHRGDGLLMASLAAALIISDFHDPLSCELAADEGIGSKRA